MSSADTHPLPITVVGLFQAPGEPDSIHSNEHLRKNNFGKHLKSHFSRLNAMPRHKGHFPLFPLHINSSLYTLTLPFTPFSEAHGCTKTWVWIHLGNSCLPMKPYRTNDAVQPDLHGSSNKDRVSLVHEGCTRLTPSSYCSLSSSQDTTSSCSAATLLSLISTVKPV